MKHHDYIWSVAFDPAGQILLTAGTDRTARLWDARTGEPLCEPLLHDSSVWQAQFSRDGRRILTQTKDDVARVWDVASGLPLTEPLPGHPVGLNIIMSPSTPARFSADNRRVVLPAGDNTAGWLELPPDEPAPAWLPDLVEAIAGRRWTGRGPETLPWSDLESARSLLPQNSGGNAWTAWAQWLLADRSTRTLSPTSTQHVGEYVADCLDAGTLASLLDAARLQPTNQIVRARLAAHWARDRDPKFPGRRAFFQRVAAAPR